MITNDASQNTSEGAAPFKDKVGGSVADDTLAASSHKAPRFRVKWHAEIISDDQSASECVIFDISTQRAAVYVERNLHTKKCTLFIHIPPLNLTNNAQVIEVSGKLGYIVFDGSNQMYRASVDFIKFIPESGLEYLKDRLTKYQIEIHEMEA